MQPLREAVPFGERYWLTALLAVGGMAEIYLATQAALAGFEKDVVIKRLKPELARDRRLVDMFLDEARICAVLNHPNVVHVYDVDALDGVPYIAMEYIRGEELNALCRRGLQLGNFLPVEHAIELVRQAAAGLGHVHNRRDARRRRLNIVHCDISPTNLLVTEDGFLKIIDFGIARAKNQTYRDDNSVPGKLSYMSPEQASHVAIDRRSDIYSLGIVLYEITVGRRLFKGPAAEVRDRILSGEIPPPRSVQPDFPLALESIIMRTLELYPGDRYQSAYDLADDLEWYLREAGLRSGPVRIARYLDELIMAAGGQRRPELISDAEYAHLEGGLDDAERKIRLAARESGDLAFDSGGDAWDEYDESDVHIAAALGVEMESLQRANATMPVPTPRHDGNGAEADMEQAAAVGDDDERNMRPVRPDEHGDGDADDATGTDAGAGSREVDEYATTADRELDALPVVHRDEDDEQLDADEQPGNTQPLDIDIAKPPAAYLEETDDREVIDE